MQKTPFFSILREEFVRALVFGVGFFVVLSFWFVSIAYAANGGLFGEMLNLILTGNKAGVAGRTWDTTTDGTVYNAEKLGWATAAQFVKVGGTKTCWAGQCVNGFDVDGNVSCIAP